MQYQRLDPQPIVYWHPRSRMYSTGDEQQLRVLAFMPGMEPVLAPDQQPPWPGAELWHDRDGEWYWRRPMPEPPLLIWTGEGVKQGNYTRFEVKLDSGEPFTMDWRDGPILTC